MDELRNDGVEVSSFAEMPAFAGPKWEKMTPSERRPFEEMVSADDPGMSMAGESKSGRMNNHRELISEHAEKVQAEKDRKKAREQEIHALRSTWGPGNDLIKERFQLIHFEYFVKTRENVYLPCEVALLEFSLEEGIIRKYNSFIDPGPCPKGYMSEERLRSEQRHQIPCADRFNIPHFKDDEMYAFKDMEKILEQIVDFSTSGGAIRDNRAFTFGDDVDTVIGCLDYLYSKTRQVVSFGPEALPRILPLEHLLPQFYYHSDQVTCCPPSITSCQRVLNQSVWDYESGICCSYHDEVETRYCALSQVHRWSFAIFDAMKMPIRDDEDPSRPIKRNDNAVKAVFDFTLTSKHLPAPSRSSFTVMKPSGVRQRNNQDIFSATESISGTNLASVSGTSVASSSVDASRSNNDLNRSSGDGVTSSATRFPQRPPRSSSPPPPPPGQKVWFGRGFGIKSRVSEVGSAANRSQSEYDVHSSSSTPVGSQLHREQQKQQQQQPYSFGRGRGCVLKSQ